MEVRYMLDGMAEELPEASAEAVTGLTRGLEG